MIDLAFPKSLEDFIKWYVGVKDELNPNLSSFDKNIYEVISECNQLSAVYGCYIMITRPKKGMGFRWKCGRGVECPSLLGMSTPVHPMDELPTDHLPESS